MTPPSTTWPKEELLTQYGEVSEWARHYSNVRMTVTPVLAGLSLGIMQFAIGKQGASAWVPAVSSCLLWITAILILLAFTIYTNRTREHCAYIQSLLFPSPPDKKSNVFLFEKWMPGDKRWFFSYWDFPAWIGILLTVGYGWFWCIWALDLMRTTVSEIIDSI